MTGRRSGWSLVVEGVVILVSILIAFWLDGWRENRTANAQLRQELESVRLELERDRDLMAAHLTALDRIVAGAEALRSELDAHPTTAFVEVSDTLAALTLSYNPSFNPSIGGVQALIASGRLAEVRDPELRLGLASLRDMMNDATEEELVAREVNMRRVSPLLAPLLDGADYRRAWRTFSSGATDEGTGTYAIAQQERSAERSMISFQTVQFPNSLEIRNALDSKAGWQAVGRGEFRRLLQHLDSLIARLRDELLRRGAGAGT